MIKAKIAYRATILRTYFAQVWTLNVQPQAFYGFRANTIFAKSFNRIMQRVPPPVAAPIDPTKQTAVGIEIYHIVLILQFV